MLVLWLAGILGLVQYFSEEILGLFRQKQKIVSLAAGISIAYIFLELLPEFFRAVVYTSRELFLFVLLGFTLVHITERFITQYQRSRPARQRDLHFFHVANTFAYHFLIGAVLLEISQYGIINEILFFFPILVHFAVSPAVEQHLGPGIKAGFEKNLWFKLLFASSTLLGVLAVIWLRLSHSVTYAFFGFVLGTLFYIVIREAIPHNREGHPEYFIIGVCLYAAIILFYWRILVLG